MLVIVHVAGEEAVVGELDNLPGPTDTTLLVKKVRRRDGKPLHYLAPGVETVIWPMDRLTFIEVVPPRRQRPSEEAGETAEAVTTSAPPAVSPPPPAASHQAALAAEPETEPEAAEERPPSRMGGQLSQRIAERQG